MAKVKLGSRYSGISQFFDMKKAFDDAVRQRQWEKEKLVYSEDQASERLGATLASREKRAEMTQFPGKYLEDQPQTEEQPLSDEEIEGATNMLRQRGIKDEELSTIRGIVQSGDATPETLERARQILRKGLRPEEMKELEGSLGRGTKTVQTSVGRALAEGKQAPTGYEPVRDLSSPTGYKYVKSGEYIDAKSRVALAQAEKKLDIAAKQYEAQGELKLAKLISDIKYKAGNQALKAKEVDLAIKKFDETIKKNRADNDYKKARFALDQKKLLQQMKKDMLKTGIDAISYGKETERFAAGQGVLGLDAQVEETIRSSGAYGRVFNRAPKRTKDIVKDFEVNIAQDMVERYPMSLILKQIDKGEYVIEGKTVKLNRKEKKLLKDRVMELYKR